MDSIHGRQPAIVADGRELFLTPMQEGMLFHRLRAPGSGVDVEQIVCRWNGGVDGERLVRAFDFILARHEVLRASFDWQSHERPVQRFDLRARIPHERLDWSDSSEPDFSRRLEDYLRRDRATDFDMRRAPLMRVAVIDGGDDRSAFVFTFHHILLDGRSFPLLLREVFEAYDAFGRGEPPPERESVPFSEFLTFGELPSREASLAYFRGLLDGLVGPTPLDVGFVTRLGTKPSPRSVSSPSPSLSPEVVRGAAARLGVTPNTLFQAAWAIVLSRYSGTDDVVFGATRACRDRRIAGIDEMIGLLIHTLSVRVRMPRGITVGELLAGIRAQHHAVRPYERTALSDVVALAQIPPGGRLFDSIVVFDTATLDARMKALGPRFTGCDFEYHGQTGSPLTLVGYLEPTLLLRLEFDPLRYDAGTATRLLAHTQRALESLVLAEAGASIASLELLSAEERAYLVDAVNDTDGPYPSSSRLTDAFEEWVDRTPDAVAIVCAGVEVTYAALDRRANRLAHHLIARGVGPGERVGLCLPRSIELVVAMLAIVKAGGAYVPLDPAYPAARNRFMLEDSGARILVSLEAAVAHLSVEGCELVALDGERELLAGRPSERPARRATPDDVAYIIYTSGSTGRPKGVVVPHRPAVNLVDWVNSTFEVGPRDRLLFITSVCFDLSVYDVFGLLAAGGSIHVATGDELREPRALLDTLCSGTITFWDSAPAALGQLAPLFPERAEASRLRLVFSSGDYMPVPLPDRIRAVFREAEVVSLGGATEATVWSNFHRVREVDPRWPSIPYGRPIRNARYYVLDARLEPLPIGVPGELFIGGLCLADGYLGRPELNAERFLPNPHRPGTRLYRTGDLARFMPDGSLEFLGRLDHQVKVRGFRIELGEIEAVLNEHPRVVSSLVLAPRGVGSERSLVAYVLAPAGGLGAEELRRLSLAKLPDYMVPSWFVVLPAFPLTPNGKVDRAALPAPEATASAEFLAPRDPIEEAVARIFAECLGRERVGIRDSFYELGGHSLVAVRVVGEIRRRLGHELSLVELLSDPTVEAVAAVLSRRGSEPGDEHRGIVSHADEGPTVSFAQRRLLFLQRLDPGSAAYHVTLGFRLEGEVDAAILRRALEAWVARHEPLRTAYAETDEGERATIHEGVALPFVVIDLGHLAGRELDAEVGRIVRRQSQEPFALDEPPLCRVALLRLSDTARLLVVVVHHVVFDGTSTSILQRELVALYDAFAAERPNPLGPLPIRFDDYARAQVERVEGRGFDRELAFVRRRLGGSLPILALPSDRTRPSRLSYRGAVLPFVLDRAESRSLVLLAEHEGTTVFVLLLAAYFALLHRFTGQTDLLVGVPVANRDEPETEGLVGLLLDTVVVRVEVEPSAPFRRLLEHVRDRFLEALDHRALPFERVVEELRPPRDPALTPIVQSFFGFEETTGRTRRGEHFELAPITLDHGAARTDLSLFVEEGREEGIRGFFEYSTELFDASTVQGFRAAYCLLLDQLLSGSETRVSELRLLSDEERARQLALGNDTDADFDFTSTVVHRFEARAAGRPGAPCIVHRGRELEYGRVAREVAELSGLLAEEGVGSGDGVGILLDRGPRLVIGMLAVMRAGAFYVPLDPTHPPARNGRILQLAGARLVVTEGRVASALPEGWTGRTLDLDATVPTSRVDDAIPVRADPDGLAYVIFTSGSTGEPKGVEITHRGLVNFLCSMAVRPGMGADDRVVAITTPSFDIAGLELFLPLVTGASVEVVDRSVTLDPEALARHLAARRATLFQATPTTYRMLLESGWRGGANLRALCGGEPMPLELASALAPRVPALFNVYGPTETTIWSSLDRVEPAEGRVTIGLPIHNTRMYVLDDRLEPVPRGVIGQLYIAGTGLARGYRGRPDLTASAFTRDPFSPDPGAKLYRTGDLARRLADGRLECLGRSDFQVKIRGHRIELGEIEARLAQHPEVVAAVVQVDSAGREPCLVAFVVPRAEGLASPERLLDYARSTLPAYMVPSRVVELGSLPLTANGKVDRRALHAPPTFQARRDGGIVPRNDSELRVAYVFERLLGTAAPCVSASFFDLGGNSLLTVRLVRELNEAFGASISIGTVFEHPTVEGLAEVLTERGRHDHAIVLPLSSGTEGPPIFFICGIHVYRPLAHALGAERAAYGIFLPQEQAFFEGGHEPTSSVEELASMYVEAMRRHSPDGPYVVAGLSFGAVLAFEMARQLREGGVDVPLVVLVDAVLPSAVRRGSRWLRHRIRELRGGGPRALARRVGSMLRDRLDPPRPERRTVGLAELEALRQAFYGSAARDYDRRPRPYAGPTVLIRASESGFAGYDVDPLLGWGDRVKGVLRVYVSEGDHLGVIRSERTAEILRRELDELGDRTIHRQG